MLYIRWGDYYIFSFLENKEGLVSVMKQAFLHAETTVSKLKQAFLHAEMCVSKLNQAFLYGQKPLFFIKQQPLNFGSGN